MAFIEFLVARGSKYPTIANPISALKYQFLRFNVSSHVLESPMVLGILRSIDKNVPRPLAQTFVFTVVQLTSLMNGLLDSPQVFEYFVVLMQCSYRF